MALKSRLLSQNARLQACLVENQAHLTPGTVDPAVQLVQRALIRLGQTGIAGEEYLAGRYGPTTAAAVLKFKSDRDIVNRRYQSAPDDIVGKMTIARLDAEMAQAELAHVSPFRSR